MVPCVSPVSSIVYTSEPMVVMAGGDNLAGLFEYLLGLARLYSSHAPPYYNLINTPGIASQDTHIIAITAKTFAIFSEP